VTPVADLADIEIFYPGCWNDLSFSNDDMIEMVNNSNRCLPYTRPLVSLDHSEVDLPDIIARAAYGVVARFYLEAKDGVNHVKCTLQNVPHELAELIKRFYPNRSIELYEEYEHPTTGEILKNVICGVSFLGSKMPPAVKGMFPNFVLSYHDPQQGSRQTIIIPVEELPMSQQQFQEGGLPATTNEFGMYIARRRAELGMTEAEVADKMSNMAEGVEVSEQTVRDMESGAMAPTPLMLERLAEALELERETLDGLLTAPSDVAQSGFSEQTLRKIISQEMRKMRFQEETLGAYLKRIREEKGLSLEDVAIAMETSTDDVAAIEEAELPDDDMLEKIAATLELDYEQLRAMRDAQQALIDDQPDDEPTDMAGPEEDGEPEAPAPAPAADPYTQLRDEVRKMLSPVQAHFAAIQRERDEERRKRERQEIEHFLEALETTYSATKAITGPRVKKLLLMADHAKKHQFSEGGKPETQRQALMHFLEDAAKAGHTTVPTGQITHEHGKQNTNPQADREARALAYMQEHNVSYNVALRRVIRAA
jgi:transcriptional regulator with XRE-family HTH domain